ncbi:unnamed protein product [Strongylus vulgaris]|uniref:SCP domain-containing protein n=1 Tax=Strongylus vulgaris TaxID=40348 RepID=A0A3P7L3T1_STRVU|nr:unnamed protein product [Strongylus vulgaris]
MVAVPACNAAYYERANYGCRNREMTDAIRDQILKIILVWWGEAKKYGVNSRNMHRDGTATWSKRPKMPLSLALTRSKQGQVLDKAYKDTRIFCSYWSKKKTSFSNASAQIDQTLRRWWGEAKKYGVNSRNEYTILNLFGFASVSSTKQQIYSIQQYSGIDSSYFQMVNSDTTKIGCAYKICRSSGTKFTILCLYNEIGYYSNMSLWETGPACEVGADCTTYEESGCSNGLCTKDRDIPDTNHICPKNAGMTDRIRKMFLNLHNKYRSSLARGLEPDGLGGYAPKASNMFKMKYDCSVEAKAIKHANKCIYAHSTEKERTGFGENIFRANFPSFNRVKAAYQASYLWWKELRDYGVGPSSEFSISIADRPGMDISHYAQMAWATTYRLGCAVVTCPEYTYGVCQYGPADYGVGPSSEFSISLADRPGMDISHYTQVDNFFYLFLHKRIREIQMAWATTYRLGCAVVTCPEYTYGVCQYGPA